MTWPLKLRLVHLERDQVRGTRDYGPAEVLPDRMRWLEPEAYESFVESLNHLVIVSDLFRSPESSLAAVRERRGAQPPAWSGHNYGLCLDLDLQATLKTKHWRSKPALDRWMVAKGWYCHRTDGRLRAEAWHYNFLGVGTAANPYWVAEEPRTSAAIERKIRDLYGKFFDLSTEEIQRALSTLRLYSGAIDGDYGPLSKEGVRAFQRMWRLKEDGVAGRRTQRTLAYVTAERVIVSAE